MTLFADLSKSVLTIINNKEGRLEGKLKVVTLQEKESHCGMHFLTQRRNVSTQNTVIYRFFSEFMVYCTDRVAKLWS